MGGRGHEIAQEIQGLPARPDQDGLVAAGVPRGDDDVDAGSDFPVAVDEVDQPGLLEGKKFSGEITRSGPARWAAGPLPIPPSG